jgi:hypothetical protein
MLWHDTLLEHIREHGLGLCFTAHFGPGSETLGDSPSQDTRQRWKIAFVNEQIRPSTSTPQAIDPCSERL